MVSDPLFEPSAAMSRRGFMARSLTAGVGLAAANLTWETLAAREAGAASMADLPELTKFLSRDQVADLLKTALAAGGEFAEVYGEYTINTGIRLDEMKVKSVDYNILSGVGIRVIDGDQVGYAYADTYDMTELREAARVAAAIARAGSGATPKPFQVSAARPPFVLKTPLPLNLAEEAKLALCRRVDTAARAHDGKISQVTVVWGDQAKRILVANSEGTWAEDAQFITRMTCQAQALDGNNRQSGVGRLGGQVDGDFFDANPPEQIGVRAATAAVGKLAAKPAKAGKYEVVINNGWGGVLAHECFGHSLEGDGIRRKTSVRATQLGQQVAATMVEIYDDSTVPNGRGSFTVDDEGTPSQKTHVVEKGILKGYLWDRLNAKLAGFTSSGNGRRNSYRDYPIPRMTNTYIGPGTSTPEEIIASVKDGLYCKDLGGGSVDPASGNFSFFVTEGYQIENGKLAGAVTNTTLTGNATDAMMKIVMIGNNLEIDRVSGNCGKEGQWKPVGVGQPTLKFSEITVGGAA
jgi:TldD protein